MSIQPSFSPRRSVVSSASLPRPKPATLAIRGGCAPAAKSRCAAVRLRKLDTRIVLSATEARQGELSYRSLYVLGASLALATLAMIGVALAFQ
jgi:hypothetical protein